MDVHGHPKKWQKMPKVAQRRQNRLLFCLLHMNCNRCILKMKVHIKCIQCLTLKKLIIKQAFKCNLKIY